MIVPKNFLRRLRSLVLRRYGHVGEDGNAPSDPLRPGWANTLDADAIDYLYAESRARLVEQIHGIDSVPAKAKAVAGFATLVMLATGLLGDLRIAFSDEVVDSMLSVIAVLGFVGTVSTTGLILWPRAVATGVLPAWLGEYALGGANATYLKAAAVEVQVNAFIRNRATDRRNGHLFTATMMFAGIEGAAVVALFVARAWGTAP